MIARRTHRKRNGSNWIVSGLFTVATLGVLPLGLSGHSGHWLAEAQNFGQRVIQGKVFDGDAPVTGATVFLKNLKNRNVKSFTTVEGAFRFAQVGMVDDYEVWAELGKKKSAVKPVSSFDSRKDVEFDLKLK